MTPNDPRGCDMMNIVLFHIATSFPWGPHMRRLLFVAFLLTHGANAHAQTDARQTPWALAIRHGHRDVVALLE